jgi:hypothetical protein
VTVQAPRARSGAHDAAAIVRMVDGSADWLAESDDDDRSVLQAQILKSQFIVPLCRKCTRALTFENVSKSRRGQRAVRPRCSRVVWTGKFNIISSMVQTRLELWAGRSLILWLQVHIWDRLGHILDT